MYSPLQRVVLNQLAGIRWLRAVKDRISTIPPQYEDVEYSLSVTRQHVGALKECGLDTLKDRVIVEIGPGGNLGNALILAVAGAQRVYCVDNYRHVDFQSRLASFYRRLVDRILDDPSAALSGVMDSVSTERIRAALDDVITCGADTIAFNEERIRYLAPCEAEAIPLPDASVDVVFSQAVLEHVRQPAQVCREFARVLRPGGWTSHVIDLRDHFDASGLQMLRYPRWLWELMSSHSHGHVNRARAPHFESYFRDSGFELLRSDATEKLPNASALLGRVDEEFSGLSVDQLAIVGLAVVGRRGS